MKCRQCQHENPPQARFCMKCGAGLTLTCGRCHAELPTGAAFCIGCGQPVGLPSATQARFAAPETYTPKHLAEKILISRGALEGERKQVTVLFADLKGSMELLADRDPEEARKLLDPVLELMMDAVHRFEGTVNQVMGDGIMALFGAPVAHEDHAVRACYAALRLQEAAKRYSEQVRRSVGVPVHVRVGLNSGEVVVRSIGSDLRMDYTAVGQTTHLAARLEQAASPDSILISAETLRLVEGYVQVKPLGPIPVKGLPEPVEVYEMTGAGAARSRLQAAAARGLTRFVGRDAEVEQLRRALEKAGQGHGQVVGVVGEPGVGKSRLFWEFTRSHRTRGWLILESSSVSYGKATPYLPLVDLLKAYLQIEPRDDERKIREKLSGKLITLDQTLLPTLPVFLSLLDVPVEDAQWQAMDPAQRRQRTLEAVKRLLFRESQVQPLLLIFEDLHWIDSETQAFLDSLIESFPTARVLLLVNYRPEYEHRWGPKTYYTQLRIDPLPPESAGQLLDALLGDHPDLRPIKDLLVARTEGNPFFLEESVRTLVETHVLAGDRGAYRLVKPLEGIQVPATVQAVLAARIDRLAPDDKRLLQAASVIGESVPFGLLQAVADAPDEELRRGLSRLQAAEFLYETSLFPELEYTFKHGLTYQVAYNSLLAERRRPLHARIVEAIERLYPDRLAEHVERLAHHAFRGEVWEKALPYSRQAGAKAAARSAYREAAACFEQALAALRHLPESRDTMEQTIDLRIDLRSSLFPLREFGRIIDHLREAEILAKTIGDQRRLGVVSVFTTAHFWVTGDQDSAVEFGHRALTIAEDLGDLALRVEANYRLGQVYHALGNYPRAIEFLKSAVALLEGDLIRERFGFQFGLPSVLSRIWLVYCLAERGQFAEGAARAEEAVRIAESADSPVTLIGAFNSVGTLYLRKGDLDKAVPALERGIELGKAADIPLWFPAVASNLGAAYALSGRVAEALPLLEQVAEEGAGRLGQALRVAHLSEAYLLAGRIDESVELAGRALDLSRERKERGNEAYALRLLGEIASHRDPSDAETAERHYRQVLVLVGELGMRPLAARCHLGLGRLHRRTGDGPKARAHLTTAASMFREMDMRFWLEKAEAELKELR